MERQTASHFSGRGASSYVISYCSKIEEVPRHLGESNLVAGHVTRFVIQPQAEKEFCRVDNVELLFGIWIQVVMGKHIHKQSVKYQIYSLCIELSPISVTLLYFLQLKLIQVKISQCVWKENLFWPPSQGYCTEPDQLLNVVVAG